MQAIAPIRPFSDLRRLSGEILRQLQEHPVVLTLRGRPRAVLVDYEAYNRMVRRQEALETARDALLLQRAQEAADGYLPFEALVDQYKELFGEDLALPDAEA